MAGRYIKPDAYHCPECGNEICGSDRLYLHDGRWMCEDDIRKIIGLKAVPIGAEFTLGDLCDALRIQDRPAAAVIEEEAHLFHGEGELL